MAEKSEKVEHVMGVPAVVDASKTALAEVPEYLRTDAGLGTESITSDDVRPPRLRLCQSGTPQRKPGDAKQIKGLNEMDMFNDLSGEIYGPGPLRFVVIKTLGTRHIQFAPMDEGGGVIDFNVAANDPRTQFTSAADGSRVKPVATKFYDYLIWLPDSGEVVAWSLKSSQIKLAQTLNGNLKFPIKLADGTRVQNPPAWARTFSLTSTMERKDSFAWCNYVLHIEPGFTDNDTAALCAAQYAAFAGKKIEIAVDESDAGEVGGDAVPF